MAGHDLSARFANCAPDRPGGDDYVVGKSDNRDEIRYQVDRLRVVRERYEQPPANSPGDSPIPCQGHQQAKQIGVKPEHLRSRHVPRRGDEGDENQCGKRR